MADNAKPPGAGAGGPGRPKARGTERPFDMWLQKQLHAMYDEIASEPLPDDLLSLIDKDAARSEGDESDVTKERSKK